MDYSTTPTLESLGELARKRVLLRTDFNVPIRDGKITSDIRIHAALPTIRELLAAGASIIVMSHLGRPKGQGVEAEFSLAPVAARLGELLEIDVAVSPEVIGSTTTDMAQSLDAGQVMVLENLRFHAGEKSSDESFGKALASLADVYVNEAFGTCHRGDASMTWPARILPSCVGRLVANEVQTIGNAIKDPTHPCVAVLGGAKVSDKIPLVNNLLDRVDTVIIGGGMAYTFLKATGESIGKSLLDESRVEDCKRVMERAKTLNVEIALPTDHICAASIDASECVTSNRVADDHAGFDIGPKTGERFAEILRSAKTVLFNGPMGVFENPAFANGTRGVVEAIVEATDTGCKSIVGGGDSASAIEAFSDPSRVSHVSTGGGASLTLLQGAPMPALDAILESR